MHLPGCYQVNDSQREIASCTQSRAECGLPEAGFVFCSFNNNFKITPEMFGVWMTLLKEVPGSVLWLLEGNRYAPANLCREAKRRGVAGERLVFAPHRPPGRAPGAASIGGPVPGHFSVQWPYNCQRCPVGRLSGADDGWRDVCITGGGQSANRS